MLIINKTRYSLQRPSCFTIRVAKLQFFFNIRQYLLQNNTNRTDFSGEKQEMKNEETINEELRMKNEE